MGIQWPEVGVYLSSLAVVIVIFEGEIPRVGRNSRAGVNWL